MGNSEIIVKAMLSCLPEGIEREMIRLTDLDVKACQACYACLPAEKNCVLKDDLDFLLAKIKAADAVIIGSPCYFLGPHTSIKQIGDRLISLLANSKDYAGKKCVTAVVYGIPDWEGYAQEAVNNFARFLHLEVVGTMLVQAAIPGEVIRPDIIAKASALALQFIGPRASEPAPVPDSSTTQNLICRDCGSSLLQISTSGSIRCVMCGAAGVMEITKEGCHINFMPRKYGRFSQVGMEEHSQLLADSKKQYIATRQELRERKKLYQNDDWWVG
jgi:NAD(P)H-dependent FMN reductase